MQWQRLLSAAVVGAAAVGCESSPSLHASDVGAPALVQPAGAARAQKADAEVRPAGGNVAE
ncbi:MAG TPA: hypothetical protein VFW33_09520, partial [Gemmataceae bacterium]|nr:hypothetical protein [Gemmataceae bacterium]